MMPTVKPLRGWRLAQFVEHRLGHRRVEILRRQPVAAADHQRHRRALARAPPPAPACSPRRDTAARLARRVPWSAPARQPRARCAAAPPGSASAANGRYSRTCSTPTFSPRSAKRRGGRARRLGARAHQDDDALGVRRAVIVEQVVLPPGQTRRSGPSAAARSAARVRRTDSPSRAPGRTCRGCARCRG